MRVILFIAVLITACNVECSRILVVFPVPSPSHHFLGNALAKELAKAGHDVTMISPFEEKNPPKNGTYRNIVLTNLQKQVFGKLQINFFKMENQNPFLNIVMMNRFGSEISKAALEHPNMQKLLKSNEHFDIVIMEQFNIDALKGLAYRFQAPLILFSTIGPIIWVDTLFGNPAPPSYVPTSFLSYTSNMTFKQRLVNWLFSVAATLNLHLLAFPAQNRIMKKHFPDAPDLSILNYNASLVFMNAHESIQTAIPHVPNIIDIGGFHISPPKKLPKDLKNFMDSAKDGVVYFSMGSNIKPSQMTEEKKQAILKALGKLKQKVLWKWDDDTLQVKPDNIKLAKWFPQADILAHPSTKLFITHGGLLSAMETIYHGVPVLTVPVFGDQKMNAARAEADGYGVTLPYSQITEETLTEALNQLLNDPKYTENAKRRSKWMRDRPVNPLDLAIYWTEFVIRHRGAPHLRVAGIDLPWYKYLSLDVVAFVILVIVSFISLLCFVIRKKFCARRKNKDMLKKII